MYSTTPVFDPSHRSEPDTVRQLRPALGDILDDDYQEISEDQCQRALSQRHRRLSIVTADMVETVAHAAQEEAKTNPQNLHQQVAALSKAMWVHMIAERLRTGQAVSNMLMQQAYGMEALGEKLRQSSPDKDQKSFTDRHPGGDDNASQMSAMENHFCGEGAHQETAQEERALKSTQSLCSPVNQPHPVAFASAPESIQANPLTSRQDIVSPVQPTNANNNTDKTLPPVSAADGQSEGFNFIAMTDECFVAPHHALQAPFPPDKLFTEPPPIDPAKAKPPD